MHFYTNFFPYQPYEKGGAYLCYPLYMSLNSPLSMSKEVIFLLLVRNLLLREK